MCKFLQSYKKQHCSVLLGNTEIMTHMNIFLTYLDQRWYSNTTIARHKSYLIYFALRLLENDKPMTYETIRSYKHDMMFYVSNNTVYKYLTSISAYANFRNKIFDDYSIRPERIDYPKYEKEKSWWFYLNTSYF